MQPLRERADKDTKGNQIGGYDLSGGRYAEKKRTRKTRAAAAARGKREREPRARSAAQRGRIKRRGEMRRTIFEEEKEEERRQP